MKSGTDPAVFSVSNSLTSFLPLLLQNRTYCAHLLWWIYLISHRPSMSMFNLSISLTTLDCIPAWDRLLTFHVVIRFGLLNICSLPELMVDLFLFVVSALHDSGLDSMDANSSAEWKDSNRDWASEFPEFLLGDVLEVNTLLINLALTQSILNLFSWTSAHFINYILRVVWAQERCILAISSWPIVARVRQLFCVSLQRGVAGRHVLHCRLTRLTLQVDTIRTPK